MGINRGPPESNGQRSVENPSKIQREKFSFGMTREGNPELIWDEGDNQENSNIILFSDIPQFPTYTYTQN